MIVSFYQSPVQQLLQVSQRERQDHSLLHIRIILTPQALLMTKFFSTLVSDRLSEWRQTRTFPLTFVLFKELSRRKLEMEIKE